MKNLFLLQKTLRFLIKISLQYVAFIFLYNKYKSFNFITRHTTLFFITFKVCLKLTAAQTALNSNVLVKCKKVYFRVIINKYNFQARNEL